MYSSTGVLLVAATRNAANTGILWAADGFGDEFVPVLTNVAYTNVREQWGQDEGEKRKGVSDRASACPKTVPLGPSEAREGGNEHAPRRTLTR